MRRDSAPASGKAGWISSDRCTVVTSRSAAVVFAALLAAFGAGAEPAAEEPATALPINLDARSSEIDRVNGHVTFRGLKITQGSLTVEADTGEASRLDFEDSRWVFTGHVVLETGTTRGICDSAELTFIGHQLRVALLKGTPASFEQRPQTGRQAARGRANSLEYNLDAGVISLGGDAWVSDGSNEVSGERLSYDLRKQFVLADSSGGKQVRMRISPPPRKATTGKAP